MTLYDNPQLPRHIGINFVAMDFETAAGRRDTACAVSLVRVRDGVIVDSYESLINPECEFSPYNIQIHNITPDMVFDAPTFPLIAPELRRFIDNDILVAHNASFDIDVLRKMHARYCLPVPDYSYLCTVQSARAAFPEFCNYRLDTLCASLGIALYQHHNSMCDVCACADLLIAIAAMLEASTIDDLIDKLDMPQSIQSQRYAERRKEEKAAAIAEWERRRAARLEEEERKRIEREARLAQRKAEREAAQAEKEARRLEREARRAQKLAEKLAAPKKRDPARSVAQLTDDGECIRVFATVAEAARAMIIDKKCIRDAANGKQIHAAGFRWSWHEENTEVDSMSNDTLMRHADALLEALKASKPDKAFSVEYALMKDDRTASFKAAGGILFYLVSTRQGSYIRIEESHELLKAFPNAEHLANGFLKLGFDMTFDTESFVRIVGPLWDDLFDASGTMQFGCCSDFNKCSDLKRCFKLEDPYYRSCSYRKNLEAGRIFYGPNRTI